MQTRQCAGQSHPRPQIIISLAFGHRGSTISSSLGLLSDCKFPVISAKSRPPRHFLESSSLECSSTFPNYNLVLSHNLANQVLLPPSRFSRGFSLVSRAPNPCHLRLSSPVGLVPPPHVPLSVSLGLCPLLSASTPHSLLGQPTLGPVNRN